MQFEASASGSLHGWWLWWWRSGIPGSRRCEAWFHRTRLRCSNSSPAEAPRVAVGDNVPSGRARPSISAEMLAAVESAPDMSTEPAFWQIILSAGSRAWIRLASRWSGWVTKVCTPWSTGVQRQTPQETLCLAARSVGHLALHHKRCALVVCISVHATVRTSADTVQCGSLHSARTACVTRAHHHGVLDE